MKKIQETTLEINLDALAHNYAYLRSRIKRETKFLGVVKAFAYGSDSIAIGRKLTELGADYLAVSYIKEGIALRRAGITMPILVLHTQSLYFNELIAYELIPTLYNRRTLAAFVEIAAEKGLRDYPVHLNFETGMGRLGFKKQDIELLISTFKNSNTLKIDGVYSHFAASNIPAERDFTLSQIHKFDQLSSALIKELDYKPIRHLSKTSGILNYPEAQFDMVRSGIGLYGFGNSPEEDKNLIPVASLKSVISNIHTIQKGDTVGYDRLFKAERETAVGVLELGYADGLGRAFGNEVGAVLVKDKLVPIIGHVCMGMTMIDITGLDCEEGEEVIIFGPQKSAHEMGQKINTTAYEIITRISNRVKRVVIEGKS